MPLDDRLGVVLGEMDFGHDAVWMTDPVSERLQPLRLLDRIGDADRSLHVDRLGDVREARLRDVVVGPVALRLDSADVSEERVLELGLQPDVLEVLIAQIREMDVRVDEREIGRLVPSSSDAPRRMLAARWDRYQLRAQARPGSRRTLAIITVDGLEGRVAVVTGAGQGIGHAVSEALLANGALVAALDLEAPAHEGILGVACDVADEAAVDAAFDRVEAELGVVSVVVLNAGIFPIVPFLETTRETWDRTLAINLTGAFLCAKRAIPGMREQQYGRVVGLGSSAGKTGGTKSVAAYAASKAGLMAMTKSIANEYAREGITANALAPTLIDTPMIAGARELMDTIPVGRFGKPEEVAALVCFLASESAAYITGEVTDINGGYLID